MKKVLVTGANGQLAQCIDLHSKTINEVEFILAPSSSLDITRQAEVDSFFDKHKVHYCINTAAFTNVELAETQQEKAFKVNALGAKHLAEACEKHNATLIHVSTDYVFDGNNKGEYLETDLTNPINVYGVSKQKGEEYVRAICSKHFIIRTSWLYSQFGHNFYKTIKKKIAQGSTLRITTAQIGTPTNANDLTEYVLFLIKNNIQQYGTYHFSNLGRCTWFDFAKAIANGLGRSKEVDLLVSNAYQTKAKRPMNSVLSKRKALKMYPDILSWQDSLTHLIETT
ncbi:dTDP-4-dehydrorhamnose reductase [Gangjinia marincola]|uniref:dTDP-4-dehydrorhamnose reductase n=1 Tax=Gangjinia marincola TaxID=578463 RepID=A0ABN1MIJ4_9FLAO